MNDFDCVGEKGDVSYFFSQSCILLLLIKNSKYVVFLPYTTFCITFIKIKKWYIFFYPILQEKYKEANKYYQRAIKIDEKIFGPDHPQVATDLNNRAELLRAQVSGPRWKLLRIFSHCYPLEALVISFILRVGVRGNSSLLVHSFTVLIVG